MDLTRTRYQVGQRLKHPQFGEGLVVEVHTDRGREMLEVVFGGELRRLSAQREWELVEGTSVAPAAAGPAERVRAIHPQGEAALARWCAGEHVPAERFALHAESERWARWAGTDRLISLDSLRGVERFPHQIKACLKVTRDMNGREILAD